MNQEKQITLLKQEQLRLRKVLGELIKTSDVVLTEFDKIYKEPSKTAEERQDKGRKIGTVINLLQVSVDSARLALPELKHENNGIARKGIKPL